MALLDLVEFNDAKGNVLAARVPADGTGELRMGSQCIVHESQLAFFARDGRFLDMLIPGRHTLTTANIPLLVGLIKLPFGNRSPFRADVYFVSLKQHTDLIWDTPQPIPMRDAVFGMVRLRASGTFILQVAEPRRFLTSVVGGRSRFAVDDVVAQLRSSIIARIADVIAQHMRIQRLSVLDLASEYDELSALACEGLQPEFAELGLELRRFYINSISVPENLERQLDQAGGVAAMGGLNDYTRFKAAEALGDAARAGGDSLAGAGIQFGVGANLGALMGQSLAGSLQPPAPQQQPLSPPAPYAALPPPATHGALSPPVAPTTALSPPSAATIQCAACGTQLPERARFCFECGVAIGPRRCPTCNHEVSAGARFCIECGTAL
ncbi:MAG: SPFH domain-containing protein [Chloroflexia bacterium]|nr:SPFH domain-containing protein [Chloroflexia bacterium]